MRFLDDECVSGSIVRRLRHDGHDVEWATETMPAEPDELVLARSVQESRLLISEDWDFGDLVFRWGHRAIGIVVVAFGDEMPADDVADHVARRIAALEETRLLGQFTVLQVNRRRQRDLPGEIAGR